MTTAIVIAHSHAGGTTLEDSRKGDGAYEIVRRHGFRYFPSSRSVGIRDSRDKAAQQEKINAAAEALRAAGFAVDIRIDDRWRPAAEREADRAERVDARVTRLDDRAARAVGRAASADATAQKISDSYPLGQPVLEGHHSEGRHRNDLARVDTLTYRAIAERAYARSLVGRADGSWFNEDAKHGPRAMMRRIKVLDKAIRDEQRRGDSDRQRAEIARLSDDVDLQRAKLAAMEASGEFVAWRKSDFVPGDAANVGGWRGVLRVNRESVSVLDDFGYPRTASWDTVFGRRRDGVQLDTPRGVPWPAQTAMRVDRWMRLRRSATKSDRHSDDAARNVRSAERLVHGLDVDAADAEVQAFIPADLPVEVARRLAVDYLAAFDRLTAGERPAAIAASLPPSGFTPAWRLPDTEPTRLSARNIGPGDLVKGIYDRFNNTTLLRSFCGPVAAVSDIVDRRESGTWITITLTTGDDRTFKTYIGLAVYPAAAPDAASSSAA